MGFSIRDIVEEAFELNKGFAERIRKQGQSFNYTLIMEDRDYPNIYDKRDKVFLGTRLLTNLILNSFKAFLELDDINDFVFGRSDSSALKGKESRLELRLSSDSNNYVIQIEDNAPGMPSEDKGNFNAQKFKHGSYGLYIVSNIVRSYGGRIELSSQLNQGTSFTIYLPLQPS